ncbi:hypothetical protein MW925_000617 [Salmonella enterica]|nr:hypothetical protein [Salmonella enterica]ELW8654314.1 hypothetical protein [Salmonella enterica]
MTELMRTDIKVQGERRILYQRDIDREVIQQNCIDREYATLIQMERLRCGKVEVNT